MAPKREPLTLKSRADILTSQITEEGLNVKPDITSHPRHANITNWPIDESKQRLAAVKLADKAQLHLMNDE